MDQVSKHVELYNEDHSHSREIATNIYNIIKLEHLIKSRANDPANDLHAPNDLYRDAIKEFTNISFPINFKNKMSRCIKNVRSKRFKEKKNDAEENDIADNAVFNDNDIDCVAHNANNIEENIDTNANNDIENNSDHDADENNEHGSETNHDAIDDNDKNDKNVNEIDSTDAVVLEMEPKVLKKTFEVRFADTGEGSSGTGQQLRTPKCKRNIFLSTTKKPKRAAAPSVLKEASLKCKMRCERK